MDIYVYFNPIPRLILHILLLLFLAPSCLNCSTTSVVESCMEEERQALLNFKQDLIDPSGRLSSWTGRQCCLWRGISCNNHTGRVVKLDLRNPYPYVYWDDQWNYTKFEESCLGGKLNHSLLGLKHLSYLDLSHNDFQGIPNLNFIGELTSLRYLNLSFSVYGSSFSGEIPPSLGNLSNLNYLDLDGCISSKTLNWLSHLSSLKYLRLQYVDLRSTGVSWLHAANKLPSLLELHLSSCSIYGNQLPLSLPTINFTSLLVLDLSKNYMNSSFPKWMFNLTSLTELDLGDNPFIRPSLDEFVSLKSLEHLSLRRIGLKGQLLPKFFRNLCNLKSLDLSSNTFDAGVEEFLSGFSNCSSNRMESLKLYSCGLTGKLPSSLGFLKSLQHLDLGFNSFSGSIPESIATNLSSSLKTLGLGGNLLNGSVPQSLGQLSLLVNLDLSSNLFNSSIPQSLGQLSHLVSLDLSNNSWQGDLTEAHFINLTSLKSLNLMFTRQVPISFNLTDYEWVPPFKLQLLYMDNCRIGPGFPVWLQSQTELSDVRLTNAGIQGPIPEEGMTNISSQILYLDLSYNQITGKLPFQFNFPNLYHLDVSHNQISGKLPFQFNPPNLNMMDFSHNQFDGTIPSSYCNIQHLFTLALNNNQLSGEIPKEWSLWSEIVIVDVSNNNLSGNIPNSMGIPSSLIALKTENNHFSGEIPSALQNCSFLERLNLGGNKFTGSIPSWIGTNLSRFRVLQLRSNSLSGHIPHHLCTLSLLQILDLSHNKFSGTIPSCLNNLTALVVASYSWYIYADEDFEVTSVTRKGRESEYSVENEKFLNIIDLSSNDLEGEIPEELSGLVQLDTLNFSMNRLSGNIPSKIGNLYRLETLDLSQNQLSGHIPQSLSNLTFLSHLNLSHNDLTGRIPSGPQLQTLDDPSIYEGNSLCGFPLPKCREDGDIIPEPHVHEKEDDGDDDDKLGFYTSAVLGFIIGFWSVCGTFMLKKSWRYAYFQFFDHIKDKVALAIALRMARLQRRR